MLELPSIQNDKRKKANKATFSSISTKDCSSFNRFKPTVPKTISVQGKTVLIYTRSRNPCMQDILLCGKVVWSCHELHLRKIAVNQHITSSITWKLYIHSKYLELMKNKICMTLKLSKPHWNLLTTESQVLIYAKDTCTKKTTNIIYYFQTYGTQKFFCSLSLQ
jgi:hypothetical protein